MSKLSDMRAEIAAKAAAAAAAAEAVKAAQAALAEASQGVAEAEAEGVALIQEAVADVAADVMPGSYNLTVADDGTVTVTPAVKATGGRKAGTPGTGEPQGEGAVAKEIRRLFYQEGKSVREIAEIMRTSGGAVNRALGAMAQAHARRAAGATG